MTEKNYESYVNDLDLPLLDLSIIIAATNKFSEGNKIGEGGFGSVYWVIQYFGSSNNIHTQNKNNEKHVYITNSIYSYECDHAGKITQWVRNCCEETFKKLGSRNERVRK